MFSLGRPDFVPTSFREENGGREDGMSGLRDILDKLASGEMSTDEAERRLGGLPAVVDQPDGDSDDAAKYLRIVVEGAGASEPMVNLRLPLKIVRAGVGLGALLPEHTREKMSEKLRAKGIFVDPFELAATDMDTFIETLSGLEIEVEGRRATLRVFVD